MDKLLGVSACARRIKAKPRDITDLFYRRELRDDLCPILSSTLPMALTIPGTAKAIGVSARQVYNLARDHGLPTIKIGGRRLVRVVDLAKWLAEQPLVKPLHADPRAVHVCVWARGAGQARRQTTAAVAPIILMNTLKREVL